MIDVVFLLLIFFIVQIKQEDILSHLDALRPAPDSRPPPETPIDDLLEITIYKDGVAGAGYVYSFRGRPVSYTDLKRRIARLANLSKSTSVIIKCTADSRHADLIKLLDICTANGLENLSVFSM